MNDEKKTKSYALILLLGVVVLVASGLVAFYEAQNSKNVAVNKKIESLQSKLKVLDDTNNAAKNNNLDKVDKNKFQAVFLDGGQVYFGRITDISNTQITLTNIFYLNTNQKTDSSNVNNPTGDASLIKRGKELHGPEDKMFIERKKTIFWENLKPDGEVSKTIAEYKKTHPN